VRNAGKQRCGLAGVNVPEGTFMGVSPTFMSSIRGVQGGSRVQRLAGFGVSPTFMSSILPDIPLKTLENLLATWRCERPCRPPPPIGRTFQPMVESS